MIIDRDLRRWIIIILMHNSTSSVEFDVEWYLYHHLYTKPDFWLISLVKEHVNTTLNTLLTQRRREKPFLLPWKVRDTRGRSQTLNAYDFVLILIDFIKYKKRSVSPGDETRRKSSTYRHCRHSRLPRAKVSKRTIHISHYRSLSRQPSERSPEPRFMWLQWTYTLRNFSKLHE